MNRPWQVWGVFGAGLAVVLIAMGWVSLIAFQLERAEGEARRHAALEENVQLALWRMEAALSPLLAEENGRPYFIYSPFYAPRRAYTGMFNPVRTDEIVVPSPLLTTRFPYILVHFQIGPDGGLTSPQVPTGKVRNLAETVYTTPEAVEASAGQLESLESALDVAELRNLLSRPAFALALDARSSTSAEHLAQSPPPGHQDVLQAQMAQAQQRGVAERNARAQQVFSNALVTSEQGPASTSVMSGGPIKPLWMGNALLLARQVRVNGDDYIQGCWLDWPGIRQRLVEEIADLLPHAHLEPVKSEPAPGETRMLAALPVRLVPGDLASDLEQPVSAIRMSLVVAWIGVSLGALAIAVLLKGTVSLSERRAAFVSAVTHELRTPLTTLGMYTDMLLKGMIRDEEKRRRYLGTMQTEVRRLGHLVNNVLTYARLERNSARQPMETVTVGQLRDRLESLLAARAEQADMKLIVGIGDSALVQPLRADPTTVEQILFNLVDNACKYAAADGEPVINWDILVTGNAVVMRIRDHGPGIAPAEARRIFRAFRKSAKDAAHSAPGVGLGLSLSRRLARNMGGELRLDHEVVEGAGFVLTLPTA